MEASVITAHRAVLGRRAFVLLCVVGGAVLAVVAGGTWICLALYGVSLLVVIAVSLVLRDLAAHPDHRRWLGAVRIAGLVGILGVRPLDASKLCSLAVRSRVLANGSGFHI